MAPGLACSRLGINRVRCWPLRRVVGICARRTRDHCIAITFGFQHCIRGLLPHSSPIVHTTFGSGGSSAQTGGVMRRVCLLVMMVLVGCGGGDGRERSPTEKCEDFLDSFCDRAVACIAGASGMHTACVE